jgi:hypothetical protein
MLAARLLADHSVTFAGRRLTTGRLILKPEFSGLLQLLFNTSVVRRDPANVVSAFFRNLVANSPDVAYFVIRHRLHPR